MPRSDAEAFLRAANYYRFTGFALPFMKRKHGIGLNAKRPIFYQFALVYRMLKNCPTVYFDREEWKRRVCKRLDALPVTPDADLRLKLAIPKRPEKSFLWV